MDVRRPKRRGPRARGHATHPMDGAPPRISTHSVCTSYPLHQLLRVEGKWKKGEEQQTQSSVQGMAHDRGNRTQSDPLPLWDRFPSAECRTSCVHHVGGADRQRELQPGHDALGKGLRQGAGSSKLGTKIPIYSSAVNWRRELGHSFKTPTKKLGKERMREEK